MAYEPVWTAAQIQQKIQRDLATKLKEIDEAPGVLHREANDKKTILIDHATNKLLGLGLNRKEARKVIEAAKTTASK
jgi:Holliday junction resolvasome RuvABC DNA-binding subunit